MKVSITENHPNRRELNIEVSNGEDKADPFNSNFRFSFFIDQDWEDENKTEVALDGDRCYGCGTPEEFALALRALADRVEKFTR